MKTVPTSADVVTFLISFKFKTPIFEKAFRAIHPSYSDICEIGAKVELPHPVYARVYRIAF